MHSSTKALSPLLFSSSLRSSMRQKLHQWLTDEQNRALNKSDHTANDYQTILDAWKASREIPGQKGSLVSPGAQRPLSLANAKLAWLICQKCALDFLGTIWSLNPLRTTAMLLINILRSLFPAFRGYSQALIVDELQTLIASGNFTWSRLLSLSCTELIRRLFESLLDYLATSNETVVLESARFFVEYQQLEQRIRLDIPTLSDPIVRDLLQESDLFARSFSGSGFGLLSPLDFMQIFALVTEIASHIFLILTLTCGTTQVGILLFYLISAVLPSVVTWCNFSQDRPDSQYSQREIRAADRQERMRSLAYSDAHRPEIALFGLRDWILSSWSRARKIILESEQSRHNRDSPFFFNLNFSDLVLALQNVPFAILLQSSTVTLGSLTLYRNSLQSLIYASRSLMTTLRMMFQGIFLMSAFCTSMKIQPQLKPKEQDTVKYKATARGAGIKIRGISFSYPGCSEPALRDVNLELLPGESLAIVGHNGSGKSTLAKILLRILDFDKGSFLVNDIDVRRYNPDDYHRHVTAVFQGFSKFNSTVQKNVGLGNIENLGNRPAIEQAVQLAEADALITSLPKGLQTKLQTPGFESISYPGSNFPTPHLHGLSGGEWQRVAIARAFMRVSEPDVELMVFDEPTSSLDPCAQNAVFDNIHKISRSPAGERIKTVIFITHQLSTARRADRIAMMEDGMITEFGTHNELMERNGSYAKLYRASVL